MKKLGMFLVCCVMLWSCDIDMVKESNTETLTAADSFSQLHVTNMAGVIDINTVEKSDNSSEVMVTVEKFAWGITSAAARAALEQIDVEAELDNNTYTVTVYTPWDEGNYDGGFTGGVNLTFNTMTKKKVNIETKAGVVTCDTITGGYIQTAAGTVTVEKAEGDLTVLSAAGTINVNDFAGERFDLAATAGSIGIDVTGSGEVNGSAETTAGAISLGLSKERSCIVDLVTEVGTVNIDGIQDYDLDTGLPGTSATFTLNEGDGWVSAETTVGAVSATVK